MHLCVMGVDTHPLCEIIVLHRLLWLGYVLLVPSHHLPFRGLFARAGQGRTKRRGSPCLTCRRGMKRLVSASASVGVSPLLVVAQNVRIVVGWRC